MSTEARRIVEDEDKTLVNALVTKWGPMLEGLGNRTQEDRYTLGVTAMLMENQSQYLQSLNEETKSINVGSFTKFIFPVLRRVFPNLIANEVVSVQPMTAPVGAVFFLDYVYGTNKGATAAGATFPRDFDKDYSGEFINGEAMGTGTGAPLTLNVSCGFNPVRPLDASRGFSVQVKEINRLTGAVVQTAVDNGIGGFTGGTTGVAGSINYSNGAISGFTFTSNAANLNPIKAYYFYDGEMSSKVPQIQLDVKKAPVEAVPRRLKALWSRSKSTATSSASSSRPRRAPLVRSIAFPRRASTSWTTSAR
jgi:hypothetical protein